MDKLIFHDMELYWLEGGVVSFDGGAIFGVVPKPLWSKRYSANEFNQIEHVKTIILEVNEEMTRIFGHKNRSHISQVDALVRCLMQSWNV